MLSELGNLGGLAMSGCIVIAFGFVYVLTGWIRNVAVKPDPWGAEVRQTIDSPDTREICHHCSTPQERSAWFCPYCGCAVGPYNNLMPYVNCFSEGEVLRNGVTARMPTSLLIIGGYFMVTCPSLMILLVSHSMSFTLVGAILMGVYLLGLAVFWLRLFKNLFGRPPESELPPAELPGS